MEEKKKTKQSTRRTEKKSLAPESLISEVKSTIKKPSDLNQSVLKLAPESLISEVKSTPTAKKSDLSPSVLKKTVDSDIKSPIPKMSHRERRKQFREGKFPDHLITPEMIKEHKFEIECAPGQPHYKEFSVTSGMLLTKVPPFMVPPLEYCDHLMKVNNKEVTSRRGLREILNEASHNEGTHFLEFLVRRIMSVEQITDDAKIPANASIRKPKTNNPLVKPAEGYSYYKIVLIYFPKSKLGINVKSYNDVVYVESTDNTWGSTTRRFLYVGDAILTIDDKEIYDLQTTESALKNGLQNNGIVTLIVERAVAQLAANYVRSVLSFNKCTDPQLAMDVINICKNRYDHHKKNGFGPEPKPIFRSRNRKTTSNVRVNITSKTEYMVIGCEQYNPATMVRVPNYTNPKATSKRKTSSSSPT